MRKLMTVLLLWSHQLLAGEILPPPQLLFVGNGSGACALTSIQDAIDLATPNSEIRVTNEITYFENLTVDKDLIIKGGYSSCGLAQLDDRADHNRSTINAGGVGNALVVTEVNTNLNMSGFILTNGLFESNLIGFPNGGAVSILGDNAAITFNQMQITSSTGNVGGGIFIWGTNSNLTLEHTIIDTNFAQSGGGIYCANNSQVHLNDESGLVANSANGNVDFVGYGGGIFSIQCTVFLRSGEGGQTAFHLVGISNNIATKDGGGIYALSSNIYTSGFNGIVNIDHNSADNGGGIYMTGSTLHMFKLFFDSNSASGNGGALYMDNSKYSASSDPAVFDTCVKFGHQECNLFVNNTATGIYGGAIFMENNSTSTTSNSTLRAQFINNYADNGSAITALSGSDINVHNSYFINNGAGGNNGTGDNSTIRASDIGSEVNIYLSTLANNQTGHVFSIVDDGHVSLINSIVYEEDTSIDVLQTNTGGTFGYGCTLFHEGDSIGTIPPFNQSMITTEPGFVDSDNGDYHILADSPAVDRCTTAGIDPNIEIGIDFDGDSRPLNFTGLFDYDAGADEYNDLIFANGFD